MLILLQTDSTKLLMHWREPYTVESHVGANDYRVKMGSKTTTYHVIMLKKYISREPDVEEDLPRQHVKESTMCAEGLSPEVS